MVDGTSDLPHLETRHRSSSGPEAPRGSHLKGGSLTSMGKGGSHLQGGTLTSQASQRAWLLLAEGNSPEKVRLLTLAANHPSNRELE